MQKIWMQNLPKLDDEKNHVNELCHGLSSAQKAFSTWQAQETFNECRKALGGLGFSHFSNIA